jgi:UDP-2,3-diacylglucosamine pyrophosphatase LpxH
MQFSFDLISDLHVDTWPNFDWTHQATSPFCVVAGDVSSDLVETRRVLEHLGTCYQAVFYIDGNTEHYHSLNDLGQSYQQLSQAVEGIKNVVYMQDNVVIVHGVAIVATNGWWSYDLDSSLDLEQSIAWHRERMQITPQAAYSVSSIAYSDAAYIMNSVRKLQTHQDVRAIVVVTHTVPRSDIIDHDIELVGTWRYNVMGNAHMELALHEDTEHKIQAWCFGHYHRSVDRDIQNIRYVSNCRGRGDTAWSQAAYYPKRITVDF